jgi:ubiquitin carboxyl-terminal hydrolase L3
MSAAASSSSSSSSSSTVDDRTHDVDYDKRLEGKKWIPIESSADILTSYIHELGVSKQYAFTEVLGLDDELLQMIPSHSVVAVLLLFPYTSNFKRKRYEEHQHIVQHHIPSNHDIYFLPQIVSNACGTVGIVHAVLNNQELFNDNTTATTESNPKNWFRDFYRHTKPFDLKQRAEYFSVDKSIESLHHKYAVQGSTSAEDSMNVDVHYNAWIMSPNSSSDDISLYELDGTKIQPIDHGKTSQETFLHDVASKIKNEFMANDPTEVRYSVLALVRED